MKLDLKVYGHPNTPRSNVYVSSNTNIGSSTNTHIFPPCPPSISSLNIPNKGTSIPYSNDESPNILFEVRRIKIGAKALQIHPQSPILDTNF